jgi:hypothetical protein
MVLARINFEGKTYDITTKADLNAVEKVMTLKRMEEAGVDNPVATYNENPYQAKKDYGVDNLINKIHLLKDNIQLHPMLEKYNLMNYLFTQQLMCSTVGSHVAHPSKAKLKTPIIWKKPSSPYISKEQILTNESYRVDQSKLLNKDLITDVYNTAADGLVIEVTNKENTHKALLTYSNRKKRWEVNVTTPDPYGNQIFLSLED